MNTFELKQSFRAVRNTVLNLHPMEIKVRDATSNDKWGASGSLKRTIADSTYNYEEYRIVMDTLWKRMNDSGKNHRHVYKALQLLEYLVTHGSERCIDEAKDNINSIRTLKHFQFVDESGKDQGINIRELSKKVARLLSNDKAIAEARDKAQETTARIQGFQSGRRFATGRSTSRYSAYSAQTKPVKPEPPSQEASEEEEEESEAETESTATESEDEEAPAPAAAPARRVQAPQPQQKQDDIADLFDNFNFGGSQQPPQPQAANANNGGFDDGWAAFDDGFGDNFGGNPNANQSGKTNTVADSGFGDDWAAFDDGFGSQPVQQPGDNNNGNNNGGQAKKDDWGFGLVNLDDLSNNPANKANSTSKAPQRQPSNQSAEKKSIRDRLKNKPTKTVDPFANVAAPQPQTPSMPGQNPYPPQPQPQQPYGAPYPPQQAYPGYPPRGYPQQPRPQQYPPQQYPPQQNNNPFF